MDEAGIKKTYTRQDGKCPVIHIIASAHTGLLLGFRVDIPGQSILQHGQVLLMRLANVSHPSEIKDMGLMMGDRAYNSVMEFNVTQGGDMMGTYQRSWEHPFTFNHTPKEAEWRVIISTDGIMTLYVATSSSRKLVQFGDRKV